MAVIEKETRNFDIKVENPNQLPGGEVEARIAVKPLGTEGRGYDEKIKIKGRTVGEFAGNIQDIYQLSEDEKTDLKTDIMRLKDKIRDKAIQQERQEKEPARDEEEDLHEILHHLVGAGGTLEIEALEPDYPDVYTIAEENQDYIIQVGKELEVTDEGRQKVKEWLGFEAFEGDPEAEAINQLNDNPLKYYLDSFDKVHKGDQLLKIWELVSALSSTCAGRQIHSWAVGPSGSGKSHIKRRLCECYLPDEMFERKDSFSPKALLYKAREQGTDVLDNQLVFFDEVGENIEEAIELIRLLTDQDQDRIEHETVKDQQLEYMSLDTGNITVWFTSVETIQDEQLKNRFILTNPDSSSELDEEVYNWMHNRLHTGGELDFMPKESPVIQRMIRNIRQDTPDLTPIVPFEVEWKQKFNRRLYPFFYTLMGMIAKIHYKNREITEQGHIIVTEADFKLAALIWSRLIDTTVAQQDRESLKLLRELPETKLNAKNTTQLAEKLGGSFSPKKVRDKAQSMQDSAEELNLIQSEKQEGRWVYWAGADVDKLTENEPETKNFTDERMKQMLEAAGLEPRQEFLDSVKNSEIPIYEELREQFLTERERRRNTGVDDEDLPELTPAEEKVIKQFHEFEWDADINSMAQMTQGKDFDLVDVATDLEEKEVIRLDGENMPTPTSLLDKLIEKGEVVM